MRRFDKKLYTFTSNHVKDLLTYDVPDRIVYSKEDHLKLLLTASLVNGFAEGVSKTLNKSPTGETLLSYIKSQGQQRLQDTFNSVVEQNIKMLRKRRKLILPVPIAIDWHDVMFYGNPNTHMVKGTQHKKGSNYAYQYMTASVLVDGERIVVSVLPIAKRDVYSLTKRVLEQLQELEIKIRYITLDGGFFSIDLIRFLEESKIRYILHLPNTNRTQKMRLWNNRRFVYTTNHHCRGLSRQASFDVVVAYDKHKKYKYLFATNLHYCAKTLLNMFNKRWGIETSYRMCNQFLIKTTSKSYNVRLFYYLFACAVYNAWVLYNDKEHCTVIEMKLCIIGFVMNQLRELPT